MSTNESTARPGVAQHQDSAVSSASSLTPSQTINATNKANSRSKNSRRKHTTAQTQAAPAAQPQQGQTFETEQNHSEQPKSKPSKNHRRRNTKPKQPPPSATEAVTATTTADQQKPTHTKQNDDNSLSITQNKKKKRNQNRRRQKNKARRFPWRSQIPEGAVDPITLDPLNELPYPPFALAADEPHDPVPEWPVLSTEIKGVGNGMDTADSKEDETRRQQRILEEQWGKKLPSDPTDTDTEKPAAPLILPEDRPYNLYDGRALAYYMTSQLQFIDPLNRRDLTRDELVNLDRYLRRHGFHNLNVTEAYDAKGVTLSTAGAVAATAGGRAQILQQEAAALLQALFGGHSVTAVREPRANDNANTTNTLAQQYQAYEAQTQPEQQTVGTIPRTATSNVDNDTGIYGDDAGILVIDDDLNPGLRGDAPVFVPAEAESNDFPSLGSTRGSTLWSASHIAARHNHASRLRAQEFPSLSATAAGSGRVASSSTTTTAGNKTSTTRNLPRTNTLAKITGVVKPTTTEEKQRQWEAREAMKRKAALSNLTFGSTGVLPTSASNASSLLTPPSAASAAQPTEGQVERNRALADALGVVPSTVRQQTINSGWARPTDPLKEFGEELQATIYPDALILQARERLPLVLKMEKKWKAFLQDDKSASLPLQPMDRPSRTFVHHYSDFWFLHTESFDLEPNRYIHCVKTRETMAPYPLLSVAVRQWKGPRPFLTEHAMQQTTGQATRQGVGAMLPPARNIPRPPPRAPLPLRPPSVAAAVPVAQAEAFSLSGAKPLTEEEKASARFDGLAPQRTKLQLQPRTTPLDRPPMEAPESAAASPSFDIQEQLRRQQERMQEKARQEQAAVDAKRRALEAAFASDSEEEGLVSSDSSDEWVEQTPVYQGSDEE